MKLRLFPNYTYVQDQIIDIDKINGSYVLPLSTKQVDSNTIHMNIDAYISSQSIASVYKDGIKHSGFLIDYNDQKATIQQDRVTKVLRDYDSIDITDYFSLKPMNKALPKQIRISYITTGIRGTINHSIDISNDILISNLNLSNDMPFDIQDATIDIITSEPTSPSIMRSQSIMYEEVSNAKAISSKTETGTIYTLDDTYSIPSGYEATIPILEENISAEPIYVINAPNGIQNAIYTLKWEVPVDIPSGTLYVYDNGKLEATTSISNRGEGQIEYTPLLKIASVYAEGTISTKDVSVHDDNTKSQVSEVHIEGTIYNKLKQPIDVILRYYIGTGTVPSEEGIEESSIQGGYLNFPFTLNPNTEEKYSYSFELSQ